MRIGETPTGRTDGRKLEAEPKPLLDRRSRRDAIGTAMVRLRPAWAVRVWGTVFNTRARGLCVKQLAGPASDCARRCVVTIVVFTESV